MAKGELTVRRDVGGGQLARANRGREWGDPFRMMRELMDWDPLQEVARLLPTERGVTFVPAFEIKETHDSYVFKADVPGVKEEDLDVTLSGNRLIISGSREVEPQEQSDTFYAYERPYGAFSRSFTLPEGVNADQVRTELKQGVLTLVLPKRPEVQPKKIIVKSTEKAKA